MSDLPTREEAKQGAQSFRRSYEGLTPSSADRWVQSILDAYADGRVVSLDAIDREEIRSVLIRFDAGTIKTLAKAEAEIWDALGVEGGGDDE